MTEQILTRQQRRKQERQQMADWKRVTTKLPPQDIMKPIIPGLQIAEYQKGYNRGWNDGIDYGTQEAMAIIYAAVGLAAHRYLGFGNGRVDRFINNVDKVVTECIDGFDAAKILKDETGYVLRFKGTKGKLLEVDDLL